MWLCKYVGVRCGTVRYSEYTACCRRAQCVRLFAAGAARAIETPSAADSVKPPCPLTPLPPLTPYPLTHTPLSPYTDPSTPYPLPLRSPPTLTTYRPLYPYPRPSAPAITFTLHSLCDGRLRPHKPLVIDVSSHQSLGHTSAIASHRIAIASD